MDKDKIYTMKYGGQHFKLNVSEQEINNFVDNLPENKRDSLAEVTRELRDAGMITLLPGHYSTIDRDQEDEQETHPEMNPDPYDNEFPTDRIITT